MAKVQSGLEALLDDPTPILGKRLGLVTHQSAVTSDLRHAVEVLGEDARWTLAALFGPEHGMWGAAQDMAHVGDEKLTGVKVFSLYHDIGKSLDHEPFGPASVLERLGPLAPPEAVVKDLDLVLVDLQDVGARYYTFVYTMALTMRSAASVGVPVLILDRPNPINGADIEGNLIEKKYLSFVGAFPLPARHGMTAGELAQYFNRKFSMGCDLKIVPMKGWRRSMWWDETGLPWVIPSPNMPSLGAATVYPGMCLIEGTNLSEGRGTTRPFEFYGAPWLDSFDLARALNDVGLPGVRFRAHSFTPTFQKQAGKVCGGVELHVTHRRTFEPYRTGLYCTKIARDLDPLRFDWRSERYEFVTNRPAIDLLAGTDRFRHMVDKGEDLSGWIEEWRAPLKQFEEERKEFLLYE
jgi:uncharacterized protein YbbC (DUF1343 family)